MDKSSVLIFNLGAHFVKVSHILSKSDVHSETCQTFKILTMHKKWNFSLSIPSINVTKSAVSTFTEEILNGKLFCTVVTGLWIPPRLWRWQELTLYLIKICTIYCIVSQLTFTCSKSTIETPKKRCEICSKLTIKTLELRRRSEF